MAEKRPRYWVMHDYGGVEGWKPVGKFSSMYEAVLAREADLANGGGVSVIFDEVDLFDAYRTAGYEKPKEPSNDPA